VKGRFAVSSVCVLGVIAACSKTEPQQKGVGPASPTAESSVAAPAASSAAPEPPAAAPKDLDVTALQRDLKCGKASRSEACRILQEFGQGQRFTAKTPSGGGRWMGPGFVVQNGVTTSRHLVLWAKNVPLSQVGPGDVPVKAAYELIPEGLKLQSEKLVRALVKSADPPESNPAYQFAHAFEPTKTYTLANTAGPSVHMTAKESVYLRFVPPRKVVFVNPASSNAAAGDGTYAELWLGDW